MPNYDLKNQQHKVYDFQIRIGATLESDLTQEIDSAEVYYVLQSAFQRLDIVTRELKSRLSGSNGLISTKIRRAELIIEEAAEVLIALLLKDKVKLADGLGDLLYVVLGTANAYGIPLDIVFNEIHRSNMTKTAKANDHHTGDKGKGEGYTPANIAACLQDKTKLEDLFAESLYRKENLVETISTIIKEYESPSSVFNYVDRGTEDKLKCIVLAESDYTRLKGLLNDLKK